MEQTEFSEHIKQVRAELGMRQSDLASAAGVSASTISFIETGTKPVSFKTKQIIQNYLDSIGYTYVLDDEEEESLDVRTRSADALERIADALESIAETMKWRGM